MNILVLLLASLICFEAPRVSQFRFAADEPARLDRPHETLSVRVVEISLDRSTVQVAGDVRAYQGEAATLALIGVSPMPVEIGAVAPTEGGAALTLAHEHLSTEIRDQMITKLYTGAYSQEIEELKFGRIVNGLWVRAFGKSPRPLPSPQGR